MHDIGNVDPLLANASILVPSGFKLQSNSPAKGAGVYIASVTPVTDYYGQLFASQPSIGFSEIMASGNCILVMLDGSCMGGGFQTLESYGVSI